ncbi:MAG: hypothetical protein LH474_06895 [Chamaesiphon sp.]|nr:hypothetical protein [Chamaesiphon sp.]
MNTEKDSSSHPESTSTGLPSSMQPLPEIAAQIHEIADLNGEDPIALLHLLRTLEQLHREIQQNYFQPALPNSRQALYALLRDIEENGGWPYVQRWKLQALFANLPETEE